jgi:1-acyl-sn-glycerol-3-phosphate acyltransferase
MKDVEVWIEAEMRRLDPQAYPAASGASEARSSASA